MIEQSVKALEAEMDSIGERIKRARGAAGLSQQALAQRANVSMNGIARLEQDSIRDPHLSQLQKISAALGVSVGELVGEPVPLAEAPAGTGQTPSLGPAFYDQEQRLLRYLRVSQLQATKQSQLWAAKVERRDFGEEEFRKGADALLDLEEAFVQGVGTDLLAALREDEDALPKAEREALDAAKASIDAWHRLLWEAFDILKAASESPDAEIRVVEARVAEAQVTEAPDDSNVFDFDFYRKLLKDRPFAVGE